MIGALGVDNLVPGQPLEGRAAIVAIVTTLAVVAVFAYLYDRVVLHLAQDGRTRPARASSSRSSSRSRCRSSSTGVAKVLFGTNVHAAPALWNGPSLSLCGGLHVDARRACWCSPARVIIGVAFWAVHHGARSAARRSRRAARTSSARGSSASTTAVPAAALRRDRGDRRGLRHRGVADHRLHVQLPARRSASPDSSPPPTPGSEAGQGGGRRARSSACSRRCSAATVSAEYGDTVLYAILATAVLVSAERDGPRRRPRVSRWPPRRAPPRAGAAASAPRRGPRAVHRGRADRAA